MSNAFRVTYQKITYKTAKSSRIFNIETGNAREQGSDNREGQGQYNGLMI